MIREHTPKLPQTPSLFYFIAHRQCSPSAPVLCFDFMDAGYLSPRRDAISVQTAHQDKWQALRCECDQRRERKAGPKTHTSVKV